MTQSSVARRLDSYLVPPVPEVSHSGDIPPLITASPTKGSLDGCPRRPWTEPKVSYTETQTTYMACWERFAAYCLEVRRRSLPTHYNTVAG